MDVSKIATKIDRNAVCEDGNSHNETFNNDQLEDREVVRPKSNNESTTFVDDAVDENAKNSNLSLIRSTALLDSSTVDKRNEANERSSSLGLTVEKFFGGGSLTVSSMSPTVSEVTSAGSRDEKEKRDLLNDSNSEASHCFCGKVSKGLAMIACDYCSEWYHMQCVQITRAQAKAIEKYACPRCTSTDESLQTIYKDIESRERAKESLDKGVLKKQRKERDTKSECGNEARKSIKENSEVFRLPPGCNNCINCFRDPDWRCGKCVYCETKREPCLKRVCVLPKYNEAQMDKIALFYGEKSVNESKSIAGRSKSHSIRTKTSTGENSTTELNNGVSEKPEENRSIATATNSASGKSAFGHVTEKKRGRKRGWKKNKSDNNLRKRKRSFDKEDNSSSDGGYVGTDRTLTLEERRKIASAAYYGFTQRNGRTPIKKEEEKEERQCFGPGCTLSARPGSKYCSDACGLNLAKKRLNTILPGRVNNYWEQLPCASVNSERQQAVLEEQLQQLTNDRRVIESYKEELQKWITSILNIEPRGSDSVTDNFDWDFALHCAVCTLEFPAKQIAKHAERCFVRTEKQSCYGAPNKAVANPCNLYCEAYNKINKTYCKRLRVLCSEHYKPGIEEEIKICGFPLIWNRSEYRPLCKMFADPNSFLNNGFCLRKRKQCYQHHNWIQNVMGLIDVELMNKLIKIDECLGKKRWLQITDKLRGDVLSLMCNDTICNMNGRVSDNSARNSSSLQHSFCGTLNNHDALKRSLPETKCKQKDDQEEKRQNFSVKDNASEAEIQISHNFAEMKQPSPILNICDSSRDSCDTKDGEKFIAVGGCHQHSSEI